MMRPIKPRIDVEYELKLFLFYVIALSLLIGIVFNTLQVLFGFETRNDGARDIMEFMGVWVLAVLAAAAVGFIRTRMPADE